MKRLASLSSQMEMTKLVGLLESKGILVHVTKTHGRGMWGGDVWIVLPHQYDDARALLANPAHVVSHPADVEAFRNRRSDYGFALIMKGAALALVGVALLFLLGWAAERALAG